MNKIYYGFDTSNYTTSAGAVCKDEVINCRRILEVKEGTRGLRQSDALFLHIKNMPEIYKDLCERIEQQSVEAVGVSTRPRSVESNNFRGMDYGYLWWIIDRSKNIYAAIGNSGNVIYVNPEKNIVIAVSSYFKPTIFDRVDFIQEYIEPLVTNSNMRNN